MPFLSQRFGLVFGLRLRGFDLFDVGPEDGQGAARQAGDPQAGPVVFGEVFGMVDLDAAGAEVGQTRLGDGFGEAGAEGDFARGGVDVGDADDVERAVVGVEAGLVAFVDVGDAVEPDPVLAQRGVLVDGAAARGLDDRRQQGHLGDALADGFPQFAVVSLFQQRRAGDAHGHVRTGDAVFDLLDDERGDGDHAGRGRSFVGVGRADAAALDVVPDGVLVVEVGADGFTADGEFGPALGDATFVLVKAGTERHERRAGGRFLAELPVVEHVVEAGVGDGGGHSGQNQVLNSKCSDTCRTVSMTLSGVRTSTDCSRARAVAVAPVAWFFLVTVPA